MVLAPSPYTVISENTFIQNIHVSGISLKWQALFWELRNGGDRDRPGPTFPGAEHAFPVGRQEKEESQLSSRKGGFCLSVPMAGEFSLHLEVMFMSDLKKATCEECSGSRGAPLSESISSPEG